MPVESSDMVTVVLQFILVALALISHAVFVFRYIANQGDQIRQDQRKVTDDLHQRVNDVRDEYVKRQDLDRELDRIHGSIDRMRSENQESLKDVSRRLDGLQTTVTESIGKLATALAARHGGAEGG